MNSGLPVLSKKKLFKTMCFTVIFLVTGCIPAHVRNVNTNTAMSEDSGIYGWWTPITVQFFLYDTKDSLVFTDTFGYDSIFQEEGIKNAFLRFREDSLYERIQYDSCYKESTVEIAFEGNKIYYVKPPLLLSNPASGYKKEDFLNLKEKDLLQSTLIVYFDSLQEDKLRRSITSVTLTRTSSAFGKQLPLCVNKNKL